MQSQADKIVQYMAELPTDRCGAIDVVRGTGLDNLPSGSEESMRFGMVGYCVPLSRYREPFNCAPPNYVTLASQKDHMAGYLAGCHGDAKLADWFKSEFRKSGKKPELGKSCVRFRRPDDLALDVIGKAVAHMPVDEFIALYERSREGRKRK